MRSAFYQFDYGILAHASSEVYYDISEYSEKYPYLTLYMGINQTSMQVMVLKYGFIHLIKINFIQVVHNIGHLKNTRHGFQ